MTPLNWLNFGFMMLTIYFAGICTGAIIERISWWNRGHRDNAEEDR